MKTQTKIFLTKLANIICDCFAEKKEIVFESNPDMACNSYELFLNILNKDEFSDFHFLWLTNNPRKNQMDNCFQRTSYLPKKPKTLFGKINKYIRVYRAKAVIASCNPFSKAHGNRHQLNIYLDHGSQLKNMKNENQQVYLNCDYTISQGLFFNKFIIDQYTVSENQIINCGIPRNDQFYKEKKDISKLFSDFYSFDHVIAWVPTFRISERNRVDCDFPMPLGIPIIYDFKNASRINEILRNNNILLVIKPHPAQNLDCLKAFAFPNIRFLYNDKMLESKIQTNEFLKNCDAMITDYSGIYYDYLCLHRPIGITLDDFQEYSIQHGFVFDNPLEILKGFRIYSVEDLEKFIVSVAKNEDEYEEERKKIFRLVNDFSDGMSTERLSKVICEKMGLS